MYRTALSAAAALLALGAAADARTIYVSNEKGNSISILDGQSLELVEEVKVGERPRGIALSPDGRFLYICASDDDTVQIMDTATLEIVGTLPSGPDPEVLVLSPDGKRMYAANEDDNMVTVIDVEGRTVLEEIPVGVEPEGVAISPDGKTIVNTSETTNMAHFIDAASHEIIANVLVDQRPRAATFTADGAEVWVSSEIGGTVAVIDAAAATLFDIDDSTPEIDAIDIGFSGKGHVSPDGKFLLVQGIDTTSDAAHVIGKLTVVDVSDHSFQTVDLLDISPDSFEFTPDGAKLYVATATSFDNATQAGNIKNDVLLSFDTSVLPSLGAPIEIPVGTSSHEHRSLAIQEHDGVAAHAWVPNPDDGTVSVVDVETDTVVDTLDVGGEPSSIAVLVLE